MSEFIENFSFQWRQYVFLIITVCMHAPLTEANHSITLSVMPGDSLSKVLTKAKASAADTHMFFQLSEKSASLQQLKPKDTVTIEKNHEQQIQRMIIKRKPSTTITLTKSITGFDLIEEIQAEPIHKQAINFTIKKSLYEDGIAAGVPANALLQLPRIFAWDINFTKQLQKGDEISLIFESNTAIDGIIYVKVTLKKKVHEAIRYTLPNKKTHYVGKDGRSLDRSFLKYPLKFNRISSKYSLHRHHPLLNGVRPHLGVDFAAKTGTPVKSTAQGKIIFSGWKGGYGRTIIVQHNPHFKTVYAHLHKIHNLTKKGSAVKQGQVIGYVGSSGLATGPHLHYEFHINNLPKDPLSVQLPRTYTLNKQQMSILAAERQENLALFSVKDLS